MKPTSKPDPVFSLFGVVKKPEKPEEKAIIQPLQNPNLKEQLQEWLTLDNDSLFSPYM